MKLVDRLRLGIHDLDLSRRTIDEVVLVACSHDGYGREAALLELVTRQSPHAIRVIVERLNDWVHQVRIAAQKALDAHLIPQYFEAWVDALPALQRLRQQGRAEHTTTVANIETYLVANGLTNWVLNQTSSNAPMTEALAFSLSLRQDAAARTALIAHGIASKNARVVRTLLSLCRSEISRDQATLESCLTSRSVDLRLAAVRALGASADSQDTYLLRRAFADSSPSVRAGAWFYLERCGVTQTELIDATLAAAGQNTRAFLQASCDFAMRFGYRPSAQCLSLAATSENSRLRAAAYEVMAKLEEGRVDEFAWRALVDGSARVRRVAIRFARSGRFNPTTDGVIALLKGKPSAQSCAALTQLCYAQSRWHALVFLLATHELRLRIEPDIAWKDEVEWFAKSYSLATKPNEQQRLRLSTLISTTRLHANAEIEADWRKWLRAFGVA